MKFVVRTMLSAPTMPKAWFYVSHKILLYTAGMRDYMRTGSIVFYGGAIAFGLGIFVRSFSEINTPVTLWLLLMSAALIVLALYKQKHTTVLLGGVLLLIFALGIVRLDWADRSAAASEYESRVGETIKLEGVIVQEPDQRESSTHLYIDVDRKKLLVTADRYTSYGYGDVVMVQGEIQKPEAFTTDLGRTFNYSGYLKARGVSYLIRWPEISVVRTGAGNPVLSTLLTFKQTFMSKLETVMVEPQVGLGEGLLLGVKRALGADLEKTFRQTGLIHIVVLSGYNIMLVVTFVMYFFRRWLGRTLSSVCGIVAIAAFALLVGLSATVVRASIMAGLLLLIGMTGRVYLVLNGLVLAGLIMLLINPYLLVFDVGFQLSFMATLGLIVAATYVTDKLTLVPTVFGMREFLSATVVTQLFVLPLLLYQIGEFSLVAVIVNVLVLPMVPVAMLLTFLTGLASLISTSVSMLFGFAAHLSLTYILFIVDWFGSLPYAAITIPAFPFSIAVAAYALLAFIIYFLCHGFSDNSLAGWTILSEEQFKNALGPNR